MRSGGGRARRGALDEKRKIMGVKGLWDLIRPAAVRTNLQALAREALTSGSTTYRIGIDASLWIFHSRDVKGGENPSLRTIFFRIVALLQHPVTPIFVFDGPQRPKVKRGAKVGGYFGSNDIDSRNFKRLLDLWRIQWLQAPGEAEAELAILNREGKIDAVLSDDADAFLFGARTVLRNNSIDLSGSKASGVNQKGSKESYIREYDLYRIENIVETLGSENSALRTEDDFRDAMVLVALLSGGDYNPQGIARIGPTIAMGLAHAGHSQPLKTYAKDPNKFNQGLSTWQSHLVEELRHDHSGHIGRKNKALASNLEAIEGEEFLSQLPLKEYLQPTITHPNDREDRWKRINTVDLGRGTLSGAARACEEFFEWGTPDLVVKKFSAKHSLFAAHVVSSAVNFKEVSESPIVKVHDVKPSKLDSGYCDVVLDCRWSTYADFCRSSMMNSRPDPSTLAPEVRLGLGLVEVARQPAAQPTTETSRIKIPEYLVRRAWKSTLDEYEKEKEARAAGKAQKAKAKPKPKTGAKAKAKAAAGTMDIMTFMTKLPSSQQPLSSQSFPPSAATRSPASPSVAPSFSPPGSSRQPSAAAIAPISPTVAASLSSVPSTPGTSGPSLSQPSVPSILAPSSSPLLAPESSPPPLFLPGESSPDEQDYDSSVVCLAPPLSPSKRNRAAVSKGGSASRSGSPVPKRGAGAPASRAPPAEVPAGTIDDPISLSDSDDDDGVLPILRPSGTSVSKIRAAPAPAKGTASTQGRRVTPPASREITPSKTRKGKKRAEKPPAAVPFEQSILSSFFKTTATSTRASTAPAKKVKEMYTVIEKDGIEQYYFS